MSQRDTAETKGERKKHLFPMVIKGKSYIEPEIWADIWTMTTLNFWEEKIIRSKRTVTVLNVGK